MIILYGFNSLEQEPKYFKNGLFVFNSFNWLLGNTAQKQTRKPTQMRKKRALLPHRFRNRVVSWKNITVDSCPLARFHKNASLFHYNASLFLTTQAGVVDYETFAQSLEALEVWIVEAEDTLQAQDPTHSSDLSTIQDRMEELKVSVRKLPSRSHPQNPQNLEVSSLPTTSCRDPSPDICPTLLPCPSERKEPCAGEEMPCQNQSWGPPQPSFSPRVPPRLS